MSFCPHCGKPISQSQSMADAVAAVNLPRKEKLLAEALIEVFPRFATKAFLTERMYELDDEPEYADITIQSHVSKLRTKIAPLGLAIQGARFVGYRIVRTESMAA